jgi:hypothetical protein
MTAAPEDADAPTDQSVGEARTDGAGGDDRQRPNPDQADRDALKAERDEAAGDAARWRALMRCGRIKMQGSAGVDPHTGERTESPVHFGAEFWPEPLDAEMAAEHPEMAGRYRKSTAWGIACLTALADAILEHEAAHTLTGGEKP